MADIRTLVKLPSTVKAGEVIEISTLIAHPMETGFRVDSEGRPLARDILRRFSCHIERDGNAPELLFSADLHPAIAANPYIAFSIVARQSGSLRFKWEGDKGFSHSETAALTVT